MNDQDHRTDCSAQRHDHTIQKVEGGFPHSEIPGSKLVRSSPRLIAAYHVLHRLSAPRHPPNALKALDRSHDRCSLTGSRYKRPRSRHGHKKTGDTALSNHVTLCLPNMTGLVVSSRCRTGHIPSKRCRVFAFPNDPIGPAQAAKPCVFRIGQNQLEAIRPATRKGRGMVEPVGIEPTT